MRLYISPLFLLLLAVFLYIDGTFYAALLLIAALLHEIGHLLMLKSCGISLEGLSFRALGIEIVTGDMRYIPYRKEMLIAMAGPAANLLAFLLTILFVNFVGNIDGALFFAVVNIALAGINLMPVEGLDGGRMLSAVLLPTLGVEKGEAVLSAVSTISSLIVAALGIWLLWVTGYNFSLAMVGAYLIARRAIGQKSRIHYQGLLQKC